MMAREKVTHSLLVSIVGFIAGVLVSSFIHIAPLVSVFLILIGAGIVAAEKKVTFISLVFLSIGIGILRYDIKDFHEDIHPSNHGIVVSEPESKENSTRFVMLADNEEKLLVSTDLYSPVEYGDEVSVEGKLEKPGVIESETGRVFDYAEYLSVEDIYYTMSFAKVEVLSKSNGNAVKAVLFKVKHALIGNMREVFPEPESSLLAGLVVAGKGAMPKSILDEFRRSGIVHIVVLSGYNITIIAEFIKGLVESILIWTKAGLGPRFAASFSILGILVFVLMTGAEATVVRAALMAIVVIGAKMFGRSYDVTRALIAAAFLMIVHNPKILVFDASFQLSFLAMCGLIYVSPIVERYLERFEKVPYKLREVLSTTVATQVTVLPFLIYSMGNVSLVSLPANILVLLIIPYTMFLGFAASILAFILPHFLTLVLAFPAHLLLSWILGVSSFLSSLPFAAINTPVFPVWLVIMAYLLIIFFVRSQNSLLRSAS